jgi:SAM-dependent methyltransferase
MHYDPIKQFLGRLFNRHPLSRKLFYRLLDILLLRTWHVHRALRAFRQETAQRQEINVLDAGSGLGQYTWHMARKNSKWQVKAIDIKEEEIASCRDFFQKEKKGNVTFAVEDLVKYVAPETYDLILSVDVMEHIEEDEQVFANFHQSTKPGGLLLISTPSDQGGSDVTEQGEASFIEEHVRDGYPADEIRKKLLHAGFESVNVQYTYGRPGSIAWRLSMKYPLLLLGRSKAFLIILPVYYLIVMPPVLILNLLDLNIKHSSGTGLLVKARRKPKS